MKVSRRKIFAGSTALALGAGLAACQSSDQPKPEQIKVVKLSMTCTWPKGTPGLWTNAEFIAQRLTELSNGSIEVELYAAGEVVPAFQAFDAVADGSVDCYHGAEAYWTSKSRAFPFFTTVPGGMSATELSAWIYFGGGQAVWDKLSGDYGIKPFLAGNTGPQMGGWYTKKINSLADFQGLKIRMPGLGADVVREMGAVPVSLSGSEVFTALQTGNIDATEWSGPWSDISMGFNEVAPYYYGPGFHEPGAGLSFGINKAKWDSLSTYHKSIIEAVTREVTQYSLAEYQQFNSLTLRKLRDLDIEILPFPDDVVVSAYEIANRVRKGVGEDSAIAAEIVASYEAALALYKGWSELGDGGYIQNRSR